MAPNKINENVTKAEINAEKPVSIFTSTTWRAKMHLNAYSQKTYVNR